MSDIPDIINNNSPLECMRCGTCCTKYQAIVNSEEIQTIADYLCITKNEWVKEYSEPRWQSQKNHLIRHVDSGCVFLKYEKEITFCNIHPARPLCCSAWIPSLDNKECQEGLNRVTE